MDFVTLLERRSDDLQRDWWQRMRTEGAPEPELRAHLP
ncbi:MAG: hypothetical protein JWN04_2378, partial [Myxococcaceae bacterium]|nr:hypothetical protein [Myxococcaceae bacterium]